MEKEKCCGRGKGNFVVNEKLGSCKKCIVSSIFLSVLFWSIYVYTLKFPLGYFLKGILIFFAISSTALMLSHFFAYIFRQKSQK
ncbi:MAG TPA: DUF3624 family protein [Crocinitomicaceae bacterium]|nr:DUF3624 family protein [Crocinitomicaceae bacterium]